MSFGPDDAKTFTVKHLGGLPVVKLLRLDEPARFKRGVLFLILIHQFPSILKAMVTSCKKACAHLNPMHMFSHCKQVCLCSGTDELSFLDVNLWRHLPQRMRSILSKREPTGAFALHPTSVAFPPRVRGHLHLHFFLLLLFVGLILVFDP